MSATRICKIADEGTFQRIVSIIFSRSVLLTIVAHIHKQANLNFKQADVKIIIIQRNIIFQQCLWSHKPKKFTESQQKTEIEKLKFLESARIQRFLKYRSSCGNLLSSSII